MNTARERRLVDEFLSDVSGRDAAARN